MSLGHIFADGQINSRQLLISILIPGVPGYSLFIQDIHFNQLISHLHTRRIHVPYPASQKHALADTQRLPYPDKLARNPRLGTDRPLN